MRKFLGIFILSFLTSGNVFAKNLNLILDCESSRNFAYNFFVQIKNDKAAIDNSNLEDKTKINNNYIEIYSSSYNMMIEVNRYTLDYKSYRDGFVDKGSCKKLRNKKF